MSNKHHKVLEQIFSHPISMNIDWKDIEHLLESLGGELDTTHHSHVKVHLAGKSFSFNKPRHSKLEDKNELLALQHFLKDAGFAPANH